MNSDVTRYLYIFTETGSLVGQSLPSNQSTLLHLLDISRMTTLHSFAHPLEVDSEDQIQVLMLTLQELYPSSCLPSFQSCCQEHGMDVLVLFWVFVKLRLISSSLSCLYRSSARDF